MLWLETRAVYSSTCSRPLGQPDAVVCCNLQQVVLAAAGKHEQVLLIVHWIYLIGIPMILSCCSHTQPARLFCHLFPVIELLTGGFWSGCQGSGFKGCLYTHQLVPNEQRMRVWAARVVDHCRCWPHAQVATAGAATQQHQRGILKLLTCSRLVQYVGQSVLTQH